ncbi:DUF397 domain-containing protein [Streptomyces bauhiniae]|uniref:DUF397 domain-containing protein n=1 Tax=Streptomyces bauhiniae TaxID=2340725 RepID=UPI00364CC721
MTHADRPEAPDRPQTLDWTSSSFSQSNGGECIQWAPRWAEATGEFLIRDSKDPEGPSLTTDAAGWAAFVAFAVDHG